jgi:iron complex transport system substrate-binding protein
LSLLAGPEDLLALPEQVDSWSAQDFGHGGWEKLPRFARFVAEPLLVLQPGLVVTHDWQAGDTTKILKDRGIPVLTLGSGTSYADLRASIEKLGAGLKREDRARTALAALDARVTELAARRAPFAGVRVLVYTNDGAGGWASGARTTADTILALAGFANAAAGAGLEGHAEFGFERLLVLDPDLIVTGARARGETGSTTRSVIESTAALATLRARREQRFVVLPAELLSSDSQHIVDAAERLQVEAARVLALPR